MEHYTEDLTLSEPELGSFQIVFKGVSYKPTANPKAAGVLLFGLRPRGIRFVCKTNPEMFILRAQRAAHTLHLDANGDKVSPDGHRRVTLGSLREWVSDAVALAPDEEAAGAARSLINENLGPYAYDN